MKVLSAQEARTWCQAHDVALSDFGLPERSIKDWKFKIPEDAQKRVWLVSQAMPTFGDEPLFLVWFNDWSVWASVSECTSSTDFGCRMEKHDGSLTRPGVFGSTEIEDATSFVTIAALFLWDCYVVNPGRTKFLYLSHDEYGTANGVDLQDKVKWLTIVPNAPTRGGLPLWWSDDSRAPPANDPIGCPVSIEEMINYLNLLPFEVLPKNLEFLRKGTIEESLYWLWAFYGPTGRRWNLCVLSEPSPIGRPTRRTSMCADNNAYDLNDDEYVVAIHNKEY